MTRLTRDPGEQDEDAYGPAPAGPPLPPWDPQTDDERAAFIEWCITMLGREAEEQDLEAAMRELQADDDATEMLRDLTEEPIFELAKAQMPFLTREAFRLYRYGPKQRRNEKLKKRGLKPNLKVVAAVIDNARLTALFKAHFNGQYRRPSAPGRIKILRARHKLKDHECKTLEGYLD